MQELMFVGGYTRLPRTGADDVAAGIATVVWHSGPGVFELRHVTPSYDNPSWLTYDAERGRLYATSEVAEWIEGMIVAYDVDHARGTLTFSGLAGSGGSAPCHIALSPDGTTLAVSNFGTADPRLGADYSLCLIDAGTLRRSGTFLPPHRPSSNVRQQRSHGHFAEFSQDGLTLDFVDLGEDALYELRSNDLEAPGRAIAFPAGAGPRHFARSPATGIRYVALELNGSIAWIDESGAVRPVHLGGQPSGIRCSADGRFLYVALRQLDQIAVLSLSENGEANPISFAHCGGVTPRDLVLSSDGSTLFVANQDSNNLVALPVDQASGAVGDPRATLRLCAPSSIAIM
jgi:6-phosphogluconolactonase